MLFPSLVFLFIFLPTLLLLYYGIRPELKNLLLLFASLIFYAWGGVSYSLILILSILINFGFAKQIAKKNLNAKRWLYFGLLINIIIILFFKYLNFFIDNYNSIFHFFDLQHNELPNIKIILPLGISFFTFQQMSFLWDIYRSEQPSKVNLLDTALYVSFFPQLIAGPIVRYNDIKDEIHKRSESLALMNSGFKRFILGLFKKIIIANTCGSLADTIMGTDYASIDYSVAWLGIISYAFQIYFDFSGYSDMAIGLGRMFGFNILENFNLPYISTSIKEFWRRWHISLSSWFRDYVYLPLGGNRISKARTYLNLGIVFLLTGFWHGATWSFIFWGAFHGFFLIMERLWLNKILISIPKIFSWAYTMLVVLIGWVFFRIEQFGNAILYLKTMFGFGLKNSADFVQYLDREKLFVLMIAILASSPFISNLRKHLPEKLKVSVSFEYAQTSLLLVMFFFVVLYINAGSYNPFIYFRF